MSIVDKVLGRDPADTSGASTASDSGGGQGSVDLGRAMEEATTVRRPGRPPGSGAKSPKPDATLVAQGLSVEEIARLFEPKNYEQIASLYFDARFVISGWEGFRLSKDEKANLSSQLALLVRVMVKIDPKYIALLVFTTTLGGLIASKEIQYKLETAKKKAGETTK